jgi:hypothetical protein
MNLSFIRDEDIIGLHVVGELKGFDISDFSFSILNTGGIITITEKEGPLKGRRIVVPFLMVRCVILKPKGT